MIRIKRNDCNFWTNDPSDLIRQFFQKVDNAIHWINIYPADTDLVSLTIIQYILINFIRWIALSIQRLKKFSHKFYPVDNVNDLINARCNNLSKTNMISAKI